MFMKTMNAGDFYREVAEETGVSIAQTKAIFTAGLEVLKEAMKRGDKVQFIGFGTFDVKSKEGGSKINPFTGKKMVVKACKVPTFKMSATLKTLLK
jgi:DNA-binding protein HU-beta